MEKNALKQKLASRDLSDILSFLANNIGDDTQYYMDVVNLTFREKELRKSVITGIIDPVEAEDKKMELWHRTMKLLDEIQGTEEPNILKFKTESKESFEKFIKSENDKIELLQQLSNEETRINRELLFNKSMLEGSFQVLRSARKRSENEKEISKLTYTQRVARIWRKEISALLILIIITSIYLIIEFSIMTVSQSEEQPIIDQYIMLLPVIVFISVIGLVSLREKNITGEEYLENLETRSELLLTRFNNISPFISESQTENNG